MADIDELWQAHMEVPYPDGYRGEEVSGVELVLLDADIAGCVITYLEGGRTLDVQRTAILGRCYRDASMVASQLEGDSHDYFARLEAVAGAVLRELSHRGPV